MVIAGEASGDLLAAELVEALRRESAAAQAIVTPDYQPLQASLEPRFFGAGGPRMAAAGVELMCELTAHSVIGVSDVTKHYLAFRRWFRQLFRLALEREPDAIIGVDFSVFNHRFARAVRGYARARQDWFHDWKPKLIKFVSPQVWASREGRAYQMAEDLDLLLSIFPFEQAWYAKRVPRLKVEFVGHPMLDRYDAAPPACPAALVPLLLLPGSRVKELTRHLPVLLGALELMRKAVPELRARMVLPEQGLAEQVRNYRPPDWLEIQVGGLAQALQGATVAIASTGTVTMECAYFGVPTVALYKTSWSTYQIGKRLVTVRFLAMPNLLADQEVFPEFIQGAATAENLSRAALGLLQSESRRGEIKAKLAGIIASLGGPGATRRAAQAILRVIQAAEPAHGSR